MIKVLGTVIFERCWQVKSFLRHGQIWSLCVGDQCGFCWLCPSRTCVISSQCPQIHSTDSNTAVKDLQAAMTQKPRPLRCLRPLKYAFLFLPFFTVEKKVFSFFKDGYNLTVGGLIIHSNNIFFIMSITMTKSLLSMFNYMWCTYGAFPQCQSYRPPAVRSC